MQFTKHVSFRSFAAISGGVFLNIFGILSTVSTVGGSLSSSAMLNSVFNIENMNTLDIMAEPSLTLSLLQVVFLSLFFSSAILLLVFQFLLKYEARKQRVAKMESQGPQARDESVYSIMDDIPVVGFLEVCTFVWVSSFLILISHYVFVHFDTLLAIDADLRISAIIFGLLGGALASIKFFIPNSGNGISQDKIKTEFSSQYVYKYLFSPFISSLLALLVYLALLASGVEFSQFTSENSATFAFIFIISGYYSEQVFTMMYNIMSSVVASVEAYFAKIIPSHHTK
ncbi:MAG: hypothetical protein U9Q15_01410 [Patescibacteria group bacterium]|nr:hypothetical protein [Patescibacteria group bacterium]